MEYLEELGKYIEHQVERHGALKVLAAPFVFLAGLAGLGLKIEGDSWRLILTCTLFISSMVIIAALAIRARSTRARLNTLIPIANDYAELLQGTKGNDFTIGEWVETVQIGKNGDAEIHRSVEIINGGSPLYFAWSASESYNSEFGTKSRNKVRTEVRTADDSADDGTRTGLTFKWHENTQTLFAHFGQPVDPGATIHLHFYWSWPRYSSLVENGVPENFQWRAKRGVQKITARIRFLPSSGLKADAINAHKIGTLGTLTPVAVAKDNSIELAFEVANPKLNTWVGARVDKKKKTGGP